MIARLWILLAGAAATVTGLVLLVLSAPHVTPSHVRGELPAWLLASLAAIGVLAVLLSFRELRLTLAQALRNRRALAGALLAAGFLGFTLAPTDQNAEVPPGMALSTAGAVLL